VSGVRISLRAALVAASADPVVGIGVAEAESSAGLVLERGAGQPERTGGERRSRAGNIL